MQRALQRPARSGGTPRTAAASGWLETAIWVTAGGVALVEVLLMVGLLWQREGADPWARVDLYTGGYLLVGGFVGITQAAIFLRSAARSGSGLGEALGLTYDPGVLLFGVVLEPGKFAVVADYGHWHLVPILEQPALQGLGLGLVVLGAAVLVWTDRWLARHFASEEAAGELMTGGPYRFVRHPRYASVLLLGLSFALVFASILAWPLWFGLLVAIRRRIAREEPHLRELFGEAYDAYASRTARLLPGVY